MVALLVAAPSAHATYPGANGRLVLWTGQTTGDTDILTMNPDGSDQRFVTHGVFPAWSANSTKIAYVISGASGEDVATVNPDGTGSTNLTNTPPPVNESWPSWSPDGTKIAYDSNQNSGDWEVYVMNADGTGKTRLTTSPGFDGLTTWSPDGTKIAFRSDRDGSSAIYTMNPDGSGQAKLTTGTSAPSWSPDGFRIAFIGSDGQIHAINRDGTNETQITHYPDQFQLPVWSPDGTKLAAYWYDSYDAAWVPATMNSDGTGVTGAGFFDGEANRIDWGALPRSGYPRPKGATPFKTYLVPAFRQCTAVNRTHGAPLAFPSCSLPQQTSSYLTVGTPDSNGLKVSARGSVQYTTVVGSSTKPADMKIDVNITGVLSKTGLTPYSGEVEADVSVRITDKDNAPSPGTATMMDIPFPVTVPCAGSLCAVSTTANAVIPGAITAGQRAIWELGQVQVYDGGADGLVSTTDNTLFMDQGVFVP